MGYRDREFAPHTITPSAYAGVGWPQPLPSSLVHCTIKIKPTERFFKFTHSKLINLMSLIFASHRVIMHLVVQLKITFLHVFQKNNFL